MQASLVGKGIFWFILWTLFSFLAHLYARKTIRTGDATSAIDKWITVSLLTCVQLVVGGLVLKLCVIIGDRGVWQGWNDAPLDQAKPSDMAEQTEPCQTSLYLSHATATMATNASIAFVNAGSAFTIKAFEPISTAVLTSMLLGTRLQTHTIIALPLVVSGSLGFVWQPSLQSGATFGLGMAFASNILFGVRNINLKLMHRESQSMRSKLVILKQMSLVSSVISLSISAILMIVDQSLPTRFSLTNSLSSGLFHVTYTIISTCLILAYTSAVGHATCNLLKRILVAVAFYAIGHTAVTSSNWMMGAVMLVGLAVYVCPQRFFTKG